MKRKIVFLSVFLLGSACSFAQLRDDPEDAYNQKNYFGVNAGGTIILGDLANSPVRLGYNFSYGYNKSPNIAYGIEATVGTLYSYTPKNDYTSGLNSYNSFTAVDVNFRYNFNNIFKSHDAQNKEIISRIYWSGGIGVINNDLIGLTEKYRPDQKNKINSFRANSTTPIILENIGFDYKFSDIELLHNTVFNVNFQAVYGFDDYIDGYTFRGTGNQFNDLYFIFSAGLHFYFGEPSEKEKR